MGVTVRHVGSLSEAQILALRSSSEKWYPNGFYYPNDIPALGYFYRLENGVMNPKGKQNGGTAIGGTGVTLNNNVIGGIKTLIENDDSLHIPENYDYNTYKLNVQGVVNVEGTINIM